MNIVIIGTGNAATVLGHRLKEAGHRILQVFGRDSSAASALAYELDTDSTNYWNVVNRHADLYLLAVSDSAIPEVLQELDLHGRILVHTAASVPKEVLRSSSDRYGIFYPLQSLKKEHTVQADIPMIVDAGDQETLSVLESLALSISEKVIRAGDEERLKLHLAAVFCNNFVNHLFTLTELYCRREGLDFHLFLPLIRETVARLDQLTPLQSQTGPAVRQDQETISRHLQLLSAYPDLKKIYELLTQSIREHHATAV